MFCDHPDEGHKLKCTGDDKVVVYEVLRVSTCSDFFPSLAMESERVAVPELLFFYNTTDEYSCSLTDKLT